MQEDTAIQVKGVYKDFILPHEKTESLKSAFTGMLKGRKRKTVELQHALHDIDFDIKKGEFFGIVGRNGSGKSTLLKIIAQIYQPTKGKVSVQGRLVPFIELGVGFNPELTGRENVYLSAALMGFSKKEIDAMYDDVVDFAELEKFMDQKLKNYSSGMQVRLAFSIATRAQGDILLIDEVLAVGDADFQRKCFNYFKQLKKNKKTVVFVSHDMSSVREYCDRVVLIDKSKIKGIGDPREISRKYTELFMNKKSGGSQSSDADRWGTYDVKLSAVKAKIQGEYLTVTATADSKRQIEEMLFGIHILSADGAEVTATNNQMIEVDNVKNLKKGDEVTFSWKMLNIFNDGNFTVSLTLVESNGTILDWYSDAASFTVNRRQRSTTSVMPPLTVGVSLKSKQKLN